MKKVLNRFAAISLALMLMFTMGINVFAAENVEGTPGDDPAVTLDEDGVAATDEGDDVVTDAAPAAVDEETPATVEEEPAGEVQAMGGEITAKSEHIDLAITNNTGMFNAVSAYLTTENEQEYLVMALSGTGYKELYKGTYEQAVVNGDGTADPGNDTWIHCYENAAGKYEFKIPLKADESYIPLVAVSDRNYTGYLNRQNDLSKAFYPRQATIDRGAKTLVTGDYDETVDFTVTSNVRDFKVETTAATHVVGGPNSNGYSVAPTLKMKNSTYDKVTYPTVVGNSVSTAEAVLADGKFAISMTNAPNKVAFADKTPIEMTFHVAEDAPYEEAGTNVVRTVTIDKSAKTIEINGDALTPKEVAKFEYNGATVQFINKDGKAFGMWTPQEGSAYTYSDSDGKIHLSIIPKNKTTYGWIHWGGIYDELKKDVTMESNGTIVLELETDKCGWAVPIAPIKKKDDKETTSDQYYLAVPALDYFTNNADYTAVDAALATVPADLSTYTEESAAAVTAAVNAVVRDKKAVEQADVDRMAQAIEDAVKGLKIDCSDASVETIPAQTYTGKALTPNVTVKLGDKTLVKGTDYTIAYANNTNAGTAVVTVTCTGSYAGEKTATFTINKANNTLSVSGKNVKIKKKAVRKKAQKLAAGTVLAIGNAKGTVTYKGVGVNKKSKKALKINASNGQVTVKKKTKKGTYKMNVTVTAAGNGNYKAASVTRTITVKVK